MGKVQIRHIQNHLEEHFVKHLSRKGLERRSGDDLRRALCSRALSAFALSELANLSPEDASEHVTDHFSDAGIDALYASVSESTVYAVQAKWNQRGNKGIKEAEARKFVSGLDKLLDLDLDDMDSLTVKNRDELTLAIESPNFKLVMALVTSSSEDLPEKSNRVVRDFTDSLNHPTDIATFEYVGQGRLHELVRQAHAPQPVDLTVTLRSWGRLPDPHLAYYGQCSGADIAAWWKTHRVKLFSKNIRDFIGTSEINAQIEHSAKTDAERFWYLNNGITILCDSIRKSGEGGRGKDYGKFYCRGASIVNGAQTVGALGRAGLSNSEAIDGAVVLVRVISLEDAPDGLSTMITKSTNTQNRIEPRDFVALDHEQARLARDFALEDIEYVYRRGAPQTYREKSCSLDEATVALACAHPDIRLSVSAKSQIGSLWENVESTPYRSLFNRDTDASEVWALVILGRQVQGALTDARKRSDRTEVQVAIHGNRFVQRQMTRTWRRLQGSLTPDEVFGLTHAFVQRVAAISRTAMRSRVLNRAFVTTTYCSELEEALLKDSELEVLVNAGTAVRADLLKEYRGTRQVALF